MMMHVGQMQRSDADVESRCLFSDDPLQQNLTVKGCAEGSDSGAGQVRFSQTKFIPFVCLETNSYQMASLSVGSIYSIGVFHVGVSVVKKLPIPEETLTILDYNEEVSLFFYCTSNHSVRILFSFQRSSQRRKKDRVYFQGRLTQKNHTLAWTQMYAISIEYMFFSTLPSLKHQAGP